MKNDFSMIQCDINKKVIQFLPVSSSCIKQKSFSYFCKMSNEKKEKRKRQTVYRQMCGSTRGWQKSCGITFPLFRCNEILRKIWRCVDPFSGWKWIRSYRTELHGPLASTTTTTTFRPETTPRSESLPFFPFPLPSFLSLPLSWSPLLAEKNFRNLERDSSRRPLISPPADLNLSFFFFFLFFFQRSVIRVKMIRRRLIWIFRWFEDFFFEQFNSFDYCGLLQVNQKFFKRSFLILRRDVFIERIELNVCHLVYVIVLQVVQKLSVLLIVISNNGFFLLLLPYIGKILCFFF